MLEEGVKAKKDSASMKKIVDNAKFRMSVQRDLFLGTGFYNTFEAKPTSASGTITTAISNLRLSDALDIPRTPFNPLPNIPLLRITNRDFVDALMQEVLPEDRSRFTEYLCNRPLGLGIITAVSSLPCNSHFEG